MKRHGSLDAGFAAFDKRTPTFEDKFWSRVNKTDTCWLWIGAVSGNGYGNTVMPDGSWRGSHLVSFELHNGAIPDGLNVCHSCDVRACVNPAHLWLGTQSENLIDMVQKKRHRPNPLLGEDSPASKLTEADVLAIRTSNEPADALAARYGINASTVWDIRRRRSWRHI